MHSSMTAQGCCMVQTSPLCYDDHMPQTSCMAQSMRLSSKLGILLSAEMLVFLQAMKGSL